MDDVYGQGRSVEFRLLEKRSRLLDQLISENGLPPLKSVECRPMATCDHKRCFVNVDRQVEKMGGRMETGWIFGEFRDMMIQSEAHAIWIDPGGKRFDITPHQFQPRRILFSPDPRVAVLRGYTPAVKLMLTDDPKINAIENFQTRVNQLRAEHFQGFGKPLAIPGEKIQQAAESVGLPQDVADRFIAAMEKNDEEWARKYPSNS